MKSEQLEKIRDYLEERPYAKFIFIGFSVNQGWLSVYASNKPWVEAGFPKEKDGALVLYLEPELQEFIEEEWKRGASTDWFNYWLSKYWSDAFKYVKEIAKERNMVKVKSYYQNCEKYISPQLAKEWLIEVKEVE